MVKKWQKKLILIVTFSLIFILPYIGSVVKWKGLSPGYGDFPAQKVEADPGFNLLYFTLASFSYSGWEERNSGLSSPD